MTLLDRIRRWWAKPVIERAEEEQYMSQAERDAMEEGAEGLAADARVGERFGPIPRDDDDR
jgi:hypothetical protein